MDADGLDGLDPNFRYEELKREYDLLEHRAKAREGAIQQMHKLEADIFKNPSGSGPPRCTPERLEELYALRRHAWSAAELTRNANRGKVECAPPA